MAKQDRAIRTRRVILEAAAAVFEEHGYEAAKITDILARAEVTKGALYFHFESKEDLALAVIDAQVMEAPPQLPQAAKLQEAVDVGMIFAHRLMHDPLIRGSVRLTLDQAGAQLNRGGAYANWTDLHTRILTDAKARGEVLAHVVPAETASLLVGAYAGINMMLRARGASSDLDRQASALYRHIMPSVAVPGVLAMLDMAPGRGERALADAAQMELDAGQTQGTPTPEFSG